MTGTNTLDKFFSYFDLATHEYSVFFGVVNPPPGIEKYFPENRYLVFKKGTADYDEAIAAWPLKTKNFFFANKDVRTLIKRIKIEESDPQSARAAAEKSLSLHADVLRARLHRYAIRLENEAIVFRSDKNEFVQSNRPKAPILRNPSDSDVSVGDVKEFLGRLNTLERSSIKRYVRAVQLHSSALESKEVESQLLNIWIAFETLFVRGRAQSKIDEIIASVEPYVFVETLRSDIRNLWEHVKSNHEALWKTVADELADLQEVEDFKKLLALIAVPKYEPQMTSFLKALDDDPLFRQKLWCRIKRGQKAKNIGRYVDEIHVRTRNDLARIYRVRNQIVHVGYSAGEIGEVVQRAHHYLDIVLNSIAAAIGVAGGAFSIEQVSMEIEIMKKNYCDALSEARKSDVECSDENYIRLHLGRDLLA